MDAFDSDVLIYAAVPGHPLGRRVAALFPATPMADTDPVVGVGSLLLLPEVLGKPLRDGTPGEVEALAGLLSRLELRPLDRAVADLATALSGTYKLRAADASHLATAVAAGADRFITNNRRDFPATISEIRVTYPTDLPDADGVTRRLRRGGRRGCHARRGPRGSRRRGRRRIPVCHRGPHRAG